MDELKPCPFCGKPAHIEDYRGMYRIVCEDDTCHGSIGWYIDLEDAIESWNERMKE